MNREPVNIYIQRVSLVGPNFNRRQISQFQSAFERELGRLARGSSLRPAMDRSVRQIAGSPMPVSARPSPALLGAQAARALFKSIRNAADGHEV